MNATHRGNMAGVSPQDVTGNIRCFGFFFFFMLFALVRALSPHHVWKTTGYRGYGLLLRCVICWLCSWDPYRHLWPKRNSHSPRVSCTGRWRAVDGRRDLCLGKHTARRRKFLWCSLFSCFWRFLSHSSPCWNTACKMWPLVSEKWITNV